uniref:Uncharacterized protein n=1 Tax=Arundo donax TaxID=35708 RepID=A0A0A9C5B2_ARUDO
MSKVLFSSSSFCGVTFIYFLVRTSFNYSFIHM